MKIQKYFFATLMCFGFHLVMAQQNVRVYGFADMELEYRDNHSSFNSIFLGKDTMDVSLSHANLYFDFSTNDNVQALIEIGFATQKSLDEFGTTNTINQLVYQDKVVTDAQLFTLAVPVITQAKLDSMAQANGLSDAQALENAMPGTTAAVRSQVEASLTTQLAQLRGAVTQSLTSTTQHTITIQRAYFDLLLRDAINFRFGKFITPAGIWNEDHASPVILTVRQPIQTSITPIFPEAQTGLMAYGRHFLGDHDLTYNAYVSSGRSGPMSGLTGNGYINSIDNFGDLALGGHLGLKLDVLNGISVGVSGMTGTLRKKYQVQTTTIDLTPMLTSIAAGDSTTQSPSLYNITLADEMILEEREFIGGVDAKLKVANFTLQGEFNYRLIDNEILKGSSTVIGYYGLLAYEQPFTQNFSVTPYLMYEKVGFEHDDAGCSSLPNTGVKGFYMVFAGFNFSLFTNVHIKTEIAHLAMDADKDSERYVSNLSSDDLKSNLYNIQLSVAF